jgi:hypothetical protein
MGNGAYVDIDPDGHIWHLSYVRSLAKVTIRLQKDRSTLDVLPADVANAELFFGFVEGGYLLRASFIDNPSAFYLIRDGAVIGESFFFEYPYNDMHGFVVSDTHVVLRGFDGKQWRAYVDGEPLSDAALKSIFFMRMHDGVLTIYAKK